MAMFSLANALPTFSVSDTENIEYFLTQFNDVAKLEKWSEPKKLIILKLQCKEQALKFLSSSSKLANLAQKPNKNCTDLADEVENLVTKFIDNKKDDESPTLMALTENLKFTKFIESLRADIRMEVLKFGPQNFSQAVKRAKNIEAALEQQEFDVNNVNVNSNVDIDMLLKQQFESNQKIMQLTEKIDG